MKNSFEFKKNHENLYNKIIKELKRYYKTNHIQEPQRKEGYLYPEEMKYVERLDLSSTGSLFIRFNNKPLISYLTGLEELTIRPPLQSTEEILKELPNKNKLRILIIDKTDYETLNLNPFTNLQSLTITNNYYLKEVKGLDKLNRLTKIEFYNNTHYDENEICDYLIKCIDKKCHIRTDILYYKTIVSLIKTEYSKYREYFRKIKWIETYNTSNNRIQEISHDTVSTGKFFSSLEDILDEILPISEIDDIESIYLIYSWLIINFSYKTTNIKESIVNNNNYKKLNFNQKEQKTKKIYNMIGGSNGAFNALYGKAIINENFNKLFQLLLKTYSSEIKTTIEYGHSEYSIEFKPLNEETIKRAEINCSILKIEFDSNTYLCGYTNEMIDEDTVSQKRFMRTYQELNHSWFPIDFDINDKTEPLSIEERKGIDEIQISHNIPTENESRAVTMMEKLDLHLSPESKKIELEKRIELKQVEDLVLLGTINNETQRIINNLIENEYLEIVNSRMIGKGVENEL